MDEPAVDRQHVLDACLRHGRKVFVVSTSEVYGKDVRNGSGRFGEDDITIGPSMRWCYATSKALDEFLARHGLRPCAPAPPSHRLAGAGGAPCR